MENTSPKELFEQLRKSPFGTALDDFLHEELDKLNDVTTIESLDDALGRKHAVRLIKNLFAMMEERKPTVRKQGQYR